MDSSVGAMLLKEQGYRVTGLFAQSWDYKEETGNCSADEDWADVRRVCEALDMACLRKSFVSEFWIDVFEPLVSAYSSGITPNPDVDCNRKLKFSEIKRFALETMGADFFATGHYARIERSGDGKARLLTSPCSTDQTLFLSQVSGSQLDKVMFPVGHLRKDEVREIARKAGLFNAERKSSTGICFVGKRKFGEWIQDYITMTPGRFVMFGTGNMVGRHNGAEQYTVGQRARIGGMDGALFVVSKEQNGDIVVANKNEDASSLMSSGLLASHVVWISGEPPKEQVFDVEFRYRHTQPLKRGTVTLVSPTCFKLSFEQPLPAVAKGQVVALYDGEVCLGGANIVETLN